VGRFYARSAADFDTYRQLMNGYIPTDKPDLPEGTMISGEFVSDYLAELAPRNPTERMLAVQMLWQHARIGGLMRMAARPSNVADPKILTGISRAIDDALNTSRRQAAAWAEIRSPRPVHVVRAGQMNVAHQQVVQNGPSGCITPSAPPNQQGYSRAEHPNAVPQLPLVSPGPLFAPGVGSSDQAVGVQHRAENRGG